ncbi:MAG: pyridoxamine 5'-phosphate oxidase family protein [Bacteroidales bacterium]|nr:pyridoxamine 5'-phosphate oxidase family protein [Bacteroidales bacterium]
MKHFKIDFQPEIEAIIKSVNVCHIAMVDGDKPYVLPFNFGYKEQTIYIHSGKGGRKSDILRKNNNVCISFEKDSVLHFVNEGVACSYSMKFRSVIAEGKLHFVETNEEKIEALNIIMKHYTGKEFSYNLPAVEDVCVMKIEISSFSGRKRGY